MSNLAEPHAQGNDLPKSTLLSYVAAVNTPTRVLKAAFWGAILEGFAYLAAAGILAKVLTGMVERYLVFGRLGPGLFPGPFPPPIGPGPLFPGPFWPAPAAPAPVGIRDIIDAIELCARGNPMLFLCAGFFFVVAAVLFIAAFAVRRARRVACYFVWICTVPVIAVTGILTVDDSAYSISTGLFQQGAETGPVYLWWLLLAPVGLLAILLQIDLCGFLRWIIRNPITEKHPVPFLPQRMRK